MGTVGYPVSYRKGASGYQLPRPYSPAPTGLPKIAKPANDNMPPPANDNLPGSKGPPAALLSGSRNLFRRQLIIAGVETAVELAQLMVTVPGEWDDRGWVRKFGPCPIPAIYNGAEMISSLTTPGGCLGGQALPSPDDGFAKNGQFASHAKQRTDNIPYWYMDIGWVNPARDPVNHPVKRIFPIGLPDHEMPLWGDPLPANVPMPKPVRLPWRSLPLRPQYDMPQSRQAAYGRDLGRAGGAVPTGGGHSLPLTGKGPKLRVRPPIISRPPGANEKERKAYGIGGSGLAAAVKIANAASEFNDALNAIWGALPKWAQTRQKGMRTLPHQKALDLYRHWDQVDLGKALKNLLNEHFQDKAIGSIGKMQAKAAAKLNPHHGLPIGFQAGGIDQAPGVFLGH